MRKSLLLALALAFATAQAAEPPAPPDQLQAPAEAQRTASGLASRLLKPGAGTEHPGPTDYVTLQYSLWTAKGRLLDSTLTREELATHEVDHLILKGLAEGVQLMVPGECRRFWVPGALGFPPGKGLPAGDLVLDVELVTVDPPPSQPPAFLTAPDPSALATSSGLAYLYLRHGSGTTHPRGRDTVSVHYTGWTLDGKVVDSSLLRGTPTGFQVDEVIKGWTQGLKLMVVGDKLRLWIPEKLAYRGQEGMPAGPLVFDVELLKIWH